MMAQKLFDNLRSAFNSCFKIRQLVNLKLHNVRLKWEILSENLNGFQFEIHSELLKLQWLKADQL